MFEDFFDTICRVGIFVICAQSIVHFRPKGDYEKYLKLLVSIMILIQLFLPIGNAILGGKEQEAAVALEEFKEKLQQSMESAREDAAAADERLEEMTLEEVRKRMEEQKAAAAAGETGQGTEKTAKETGQGTEKAAKETGQGTEKAAEETANNTKIEIQVKAVEPVVVGNE